MTVVALPTNTVGIQNSGDAQIVRGAGFGGLRNGCLDFENLNPKFICFFFAVNFPPNFCYFKLNFTTLCMQPGPISVSGGLDATVDFFPDARRVGTVPEGRAPTAGDPTPMHFYFPQ